MEELSRFFRKKGVKRILDFSCGAGRNSIFLAKQGFEVYGFDSSRLGLSIARRAAKKKKAAVHLKQVDMTKGLPYKDDFFDAVICIRSLYQARMSSIKKSVKEISRITGDGGFVYLESDQWGVSHHRKTYHVRMKEVEKRTYTWGDTCSYYHFFTKTELKSLFRDYRKIRFSYKNWKYTALFQKTG